MMLQFVISEQDGVKDYHLKNNMRSNSTIHFIQKNIIVITVTKGLKNQAIPQR